MPAAPLVRVVALALAGALALLVPSAACAAPGRAAPGSVVPDAPSIVLIVADDLRHDAIGRFADGPRHTPHLDALAARGFVFRNTYAIGANTGAICAPSRAMLLTGCDLGAVWTSTSIDHRVSLPQRLRQAGYRTFGTGKWHQSRASFAAGFDEGASIFFGGCIACSATSNAHDLAAKRASWEVELLRVGADGAFAPDAQPGVHVTDRFADAAAAFVQRQPADEPFFVYLAFTAPHDPRAAPPAHEALFRDADGRPTVALPASFRPEHGFDQGDRAIRDEVLIPTPRRPDDVREELADYRAMVAHMDDAIGRVLDAVAARRDARGTIVVFTSDHGLALGSHGLMGKQNPYEHSIRAAPLVLAGPGIPAGECAAFATLCDVAPTLAQLAGLAAPDDVAGRSLVPIVRGERATVRDEVCFAYRDLQRAIRVGRWKLMRFPHLDRTQLFDLEADPDERRDLADDPAQAERIAELRARLAAWERRTLP